MDLEDKHVFWPVLGLSWSVMMCDLEVCMFFFCTFDLDLVPTMESAVRVFFFASRLLLTPNFKNKYQMTSIGECSYNKPPKIHKHALILALVQSDDSKERVVETKNE